MNTSPDSILIFAHLFLGITKKSPCGHRRCLKKQQVLLLFVPFFHFTNINVSEKDERGSGDGSHR